MKNTAVDAVKTTGVSGQNKRETFTFVVLPESLAEMQALPEASLSSPFQTAALTVCALCAYAADKQIGLEMLNWLRGPRPLNGQEISFLNDRFRGGKTYLPFSYFVSASAENNYMPKEPFQIVIDEKRVTFFMENIEDPSDKFRGVYTLRLIDETHMDVIHEEGQPLCEGLEHMAYRFEWDSY